MKQCLVILSAACALIISCSRSGKGPGAKTLDTIFSRTSIRAYEQREVEPEKIELLLKAGMAAPSCVNLQPWEFLVLTTPEAREKVVRGLGGNDFVATAPVVIIPCANLQKTFEGDTGNWMADLSAVSENILLAARSLGLGSVWVGGWPNEDRIQGLAREFGLPEHIIPVSILPIGYPAEQPVPKDKWAPEKVHWNGY